MPDTGSSIFRAHYEFLVGLQPSTALSLRIRCWPAIPREAEGTLPLSVGTKKPCSSALSGFSDLVLSRIRGSSGSCG